MRTEQLKYFIEAYKTRSLNQASRNLDISVQALSQNICSLEKEIGCPLFIRSNTGVVSTVAGEKLYFLAEKVLKEYYIFLQNINIRNSVDARSIAKIMLYANPLFMEIGLSSQVAAYSAGRLGVNISPIQADVKEVMDKVIQGKRNEKCAVIGMVVLPGGSPDEHRIFLGQPNSEIQVIPIRSQRYVCITSMDFDFREKRISLSEVGKHPIVLFSSIGEQYNSALETLRKYSDPHVVACAGSVVAWHQAIKCGIGIGLLNTAFLSVHAQTRHLFDDVRIIPIAEDTKNISAFIAKKPISEFEEDFIRYMGAEYEE